MSRSDSERSEYTDLLEQLVIEAPQDCTSFDALVGILPGVYPTEIMATLKRLGSTGRLEATELRRLLARQASFAVGVASPLPVPHPLDFDWRFSRLTQDYLASSCAEVAGADQIVLLGAPTLLDPIRAKRGAKVTLIDSGSHVLPLSTGEDVICLDLNRDALPEIQARVVIMDPPWYPDCFRAFLWAAARLSEVGSEVWSAFPAVGTRPGIERERAELIAFAQSIGLVLAELRDGVLRYDSPPFERAALEAAGLSRIPVDWRAADLAIFVSVARSNMPRPELVPSHDWDEVTAGPVRIRLRRGRSLGQLGLEELVSGEVLGSVSMREPLRNEADVWTCCNRVFRCSNTTELGLVLRARTAGRADAEIAAMIPGHDWLRFSQQLDGLLGRERADLHRFGWLN